MRYQTTHLSDVNNVGPLERVHRIVVGLISITATLLFPAISEAAIVGLVALGVYAGLTGFIGWDPLYALMKGLQRQAPAPTPKPATTATHPHREEQSSAGDYKQVA
ncbi:MAG: DUF2892 domain-containing protein [Gammaproteobacteria bacterium]|jgi:hypothetical protein